MDIAITLATIPAIIAVVTLAKDLGLRSTFAPLLAIVLGVAFALFDLFSVGSIIGTQTILQAVAAGVLLGLSAAGLYDGARAIGSKTPAATVVVEEDVATKPATRSQADTLDGI
ncbi:holin [Microbacterium phage Martin]|uniref:Holin n=9 Tax=Ilzatvirus teagan TaxID=2845595 RepID=A0A4D6E3Q7_9CAUD|nr:holin [Microbacterium phage Martin]QBZ73134.1 holin [Microbacterium phage TinSulphur]QDH47780.1 holin [Microbacterium phage Shee]QDP44698.1 holin [Microbacterium phage Stanktossa]QJD51011.1 holin [Microbacterium phage Pherferi]QKN87844.1 holin [Microbacterium phage Dothraki]QKO02716.1 holin [Microbacterium phage Kurt1]QKO02884.1 holin [Microbacterium Phage ParleG]QOC56818.1 holin [Microbacterium phage TatarkaPM]UGL63474.1 holin [Microbacterium phage Inventa]UVK62693.1 holin [Microbacte